MAQAKTRQWLMEENEQRMTADAERIKGDATEIETERRKAISGHSLANDGFGDDGCGESGRASIDRRGSSSSGR